MASMLLSLQTLPMVGLQMCASAGMMSSMGNPSYSNLSTFPPSFARNSVISKLEGVIASPSYSTLSTFSPSFGFSPSIATTSTVSKLRGGMGSLPALNLSSFPPSFSRGAGVYKPGGIRIKKGVRTVARGSSYDGLLPSNASAREEMFVEKGASNSAAPTFENLLDSSSPLRESNSKKSARSLDSIEERIERTIFDFRFLTLFGVVGSLLGAVLCFLKGCLFVTHSYQDYIRACFGGGVHSSRVILYLVEAVDVYLMGTVMLIFGMGLYELFVSSLEVPGGMCRPAIDGRSSTVCGSNLFGLFRLRQRPKWLEIRSLDELKTKLGHVIVMILLVGMFEKSKKVIVHTSMDFLCFSASILLSSGALYLLSMLNSHAEQHLKTD